MPRSIEHIGAVAEIVAERHTAGKPMWDELIDLTDLWAQFDDGDDASFVEVRDQVVARLRASRWVSSSDEDSPLRDLVDELAYSDTVDEFDDNLDDLYDLADVARVVLQTR